MHYLLSPTFDNSQSLATGRSKIVTKNRSTLDIRGGYLRPVCESTLSDLDANVYHFRALLHLADAHETSHSGTESGMGSSEIVTSR
jgi:hypothetical protein